MMTSKIDRQYGSRRCIAAFFKPENGECWANVSVYDPINGRVPLLYSYSTDWTRAQKALKLFEMTGDCCQREVLG